MAVMKLIGGPEKAGERDNVVQFGPRNRYPDSEFSALAPDECAAVRKMLRQFGRLMVACPTARREGGE